MGGAPSPRSTGAPPPARTRPSAHSRPDSTSPATRWWSPRTTGTSRPPSDERGLAARLDALDHDVEMTRQARSAVEIRGRMWPALLLILLPPLAAALLVRSRALEGGDLWRAVLAGGIGVLLYHGSLPL